MNPTLKVLKKGSNRPSGLRALFRALKSLVITEALLRRHSFIVEVLLVHFCTRNRLNALPLGLVATSGYQSLLQVVLRLVVAVIGRK